MANNFKRLELSDFGISFPEAAEKIAKLETDGTTFEQVNVGPAALIPPLALTGEKTFQVDDARFTLGGSLDARLQIEVFNEPTDKDTDEVLQPTADRAWLKHKLDAQIKGSAGGNAGGVHFGVQGELGASLLQYRPHNLQSKVGDAIRGDLGSYKLPLRVGDVLGLVEGEILASEVRGKLALHAKLTWADALSAALSSLDERLGAADLSAIQVNAEGFVGINLSLEDDYRLVFRKGSKDQLTRVEVQKTKGRTVGVSAGFKLEAGFADPKALQDALEAYLSSRLELPWKQVEALIGKIDSALALQSLSPENRELAEQLGARLGLADLTREWGELKARLSGLRDDLERRLEEALKLKAKAELKIEYTRIRNEEAVLACELEKDALVEHHQSLLRGDLTGLVEKLAAGEKGYNLVEYLKTETIKKTTSFGFSIGIGNWAAFGVTTNVREWSAQTDVKDERERQTFTGRRTYKAKWGKREFQYAFGFGGAMERFSSNRFANASEFDYWLSFGWSWNEPLTPSLLAEAFDLANVWTVLDQREIEGSLSSVVSRASGKVLVEVEIKISDMGVRSLLAVPGSVFENAWVEAMAASLPRVPVGQKVFRSRVKDRISVYGRAARYIFDQGAGGAEIAAIAGRVDYNPNETANNLNWLKRIDQGEMVTGVFPDASLEVLWTSRTASTRPSERCGRARRSLDNLAEAISGNSRPEQIGETFDELCKLISRPYECRLLGRVVAGLTTGRRPHELTKSIRITPEKGPAFII